MNVTTDITLNNNSNGKTLGIVLAAGQGKRMNAAISKQYLEVKGIPVIVYTLEKFLGASSIDHVIVVVSSGSMEYMKVDILDKYFHNKQERITVLEGGKERYNSVYAALESGIDGFETVLIHDGARPLISCEIIDRVVEELKTADACIVGVRAKDTFKLVDGQGVIQSTLNRQNLFSIQTPQGFKKNVILEAYRKGIDQASTRAVTDDSMMVELFTSYSVKVIEGDYTNIKITTPEDLLLMEQLLNEKSE